MLYRGFLYVLSTEKHKKARIFYKLSFNLPSNTFIPNFVALSVHFGVLLSSKTFISVSLNSPNLSAILFTFLY